MCDGTHLVAYMALIILVLWRACCSLVERLAAHCPDLLDIAAPYQGQDTGVTAARMPLDLHRWMRLRRNIGLPPDTAHSRRSLSYRSTTTKDLHGGRHEKAGVILAGKASQRTSTSIPDTPSGLPIIQM